jgi:transcriptional antiterminator NusG
MSQKVRWYKRFSNFLKEVKAEIKKVTWPSRNEVYSTTVVVILATFFFGFYLYFMDVIFSWVKNWYVVHTYSGFEKFVAESIRQKAVELNLKNQIGKIIIPTEGVVEIKGGKKIVSTKRSYPGYILIEMEMNDENWHIIRETPKVTGFVGSGRQPSPLSSEEVSQIVEHMETTSEKPKPKHSFEKGEAVRIIDGPFFNFNGIVEEVNHERSTLKVLVTIFGRSTPVELEFLQVEKI